jgi:hypothetical protein
MPSEAVLIEHVAGDAARGEAADVARYSDFARISIGVMWIVGGLLGGLMFIVVPIVHLITTWALPLGGILLGVRAFKRRLVFYQISGTCPACREPIDLIGGLVDDPAWQVCPKCESKLSVRSGPAV